MKAVIYTRVSTEEQSREGVSLDNQLLKCRLQAELGDMEVVAEVEDAGKSAKSLNRAGVQKVLEMAKRGEIDALVIYKLDRLTRNVGDLSRVLALLNRHHVSLISVKDSLDTTTASGRMVIHMLGTIAQWERETIGERVADALSHKRTQGQRYTNVIPFGYSNVEGNLVEVAEEQNALAMMVAMRDSGSPFHLIASELNAKGVATRKGGAWHWSSVRYILNRVEGSKKAA